MYVEHFGNAEKSFQGMGTAGFELLIVAHGESVPKNILLDHFAFKANLAVTRA